VEKGLRVAKETELKKYGIPAGEMPNLSHINDLRVLENLYDSLSKQKPSATPDSVCLSAFAASYPPLAPAPSPLSETSEEYRNYYQAYTSEKQLSFNEWRANCSGPAERNLNGVIERINELGERRVNGFVPVAGAKFEPALDNGLKGNLELRLLSPDGRADVTWKGVWEHEFLSGEALAKALTSSLPTALAFLTTQNKTILVQSEGGKSRHFYKYHDLSVSWNGFYIQLKGVFTLPEWLAKIAPKDSLPEPEPVVEDTVIKKTFLAKVPGGKLKYRGKDVQIMPFAINTTTINQSLYSAKCGKKDFSKFKGDSLPAHSVTWQEANKCCVALGGELPTEAQWEYAARAGSPLKYVWPTNASPKDYAEFNGKKPVAAAGKKPNQWGIYDMFGNVAEWVKDDGSWGGKYKYLKGGSWKSSEKDLNVENREEEDARYWGTHTGFRCVFKP
ncbi:MAG: formylglycine-generating enzyme family protein, partial [Fibromonadales bacterium]|nr:formylglycine-generating enzyme family protein [Fibromonadales bacterium]